MIQVVEKLKDQLDHENNYYFYRETSSNYGQLICEDGIFFLGFNVLNSKDLLNISTRPLTEEITNDESQFLDFLFSKKQFSRVNKIDEMIIIGFPKDILDYVVEPMKEGLNNEITDFIIKPQYILGYIDLNRSELNLNPNYFDYYDNFVYTKKY